MYIYLYDEGSNPSLSLLIRKGNIVLMGKITSCRDEVTGSIPVISERDGGWDVWELNSGSFG